MTEPIATDSNLFCQVCSRPRLEGYKLRRCDRCHRNICDPCSDHDNGQKFRCGENTGCAEALEALGLYRLEFTLIGLPTPERNNRRHWTKQDRERSAWHKAVYWTVRMKRPKVPLVLASAIFRRHSATRPDPTNLAESFKAVEDALVVAGILANDKAENYVGESPSYEWERAPTRRGFITIIIEEGVPHGSEEEGNTEYHLDG